MHVPLLLALLAASAPAPSAPSEVPGNLLKNPGFERGREGWGIMTGSANWSDFEIVTKPVRSGARAAYLPVHAAPETRNVRVFGVLQELRSPEFPDTLSGWYRVADWDPGHPATSLYLQVVVIVWGDPRTDALVRGAQAGTGKPLTNYQIRYYLSGIEEPPFRLQNARFKFLGKGKPTLGEWVYFETDLRKDFQELWKIIPAQYEFIRVLYEARWDNKPAGHAARTDVYYDDVFVGFGRPPAGARPAGPAPAAAPAEVKRP